MIHQTQTNQSERQKLQIKYKTIISKVNCRTNMKDRQQPNHNRISSQLRNHKFLTPRQRILMKYKQVVQLQKTNPELKKQLQKIRQRLYQKPKRKYQKKPETYSKPQKHPRVYKQPIRFSKRLERKYVNYAEYQTERKQKEKKKNNLTRASIDGENELQGSQQQLIQNITDKQLVLQSQNQQHSISQKQQLPQLYRSMLLKQKKIDQFLSFNKNLRQARTVKLQDLYQFLDRSGMHCDHKVFNFLLKINPELYQMTEDKNNNLSLVFTVNLDAKKIQQRQSETKKIMRKIPTMVNSYQQLD